MPVTSINIVKCKLLGISLMGNPKDSAAIKAIWDERFQPGDAFWVDVAPGQNKEIIVKNVLDEMRRQGVTDLASTSLLVTFFLDLQEELDERFLSTFDQLAGLPDFFSENLRCKVPLNLEFGYLGQLAFADKSVLKANVKKLIAINMEHRSVWLQLCLTAQHLLGNANEDWKAAVILMDVLRRHDSPDLLLPVGGGYNPNDDVGMLRYGEYNKELMDSLQARKDELIRALSDKGDLDFAAALRADLDALDREIKESFPVSGALMPLPPALRVEGRIKQRLAVSGHNREFNAAKLSLLKAIESTKEKMRADIQSRYQQTLNQAGERLENLLIQARVGIQLERDAAQMQHLLMPGIDNPVSITLRLSPQEDNSPNIARELEAERDLVARDIKLKLLEAMRMAYESRQESYYDEKESDLNKQLNDTNAKLNDLLSDTKLVNLVIGGRSLPRTCFTPILAGGSAFTAIICRDDAGADLLNTDAVLMSPYSVSSYRIDAKHGGLKTIDGAPMKALQMLFFDCNDDRLDDLIK